jgi:hypothetical protein
MQVGLGLVAVLLPVHLALEGLHCSRCGAALQACMLGCCMEALHLTCLAADLHP